MARWSNSIHASDTQLSQRSYCEASVIRPPDGAPLLGEASGDVLVVGAGFAGLSVIRPRRGILPSLPRRRTATSDVFCEPGWSAQWMDNNEMSGSP